jgi:hypothetical protein
VICDRLVVSSTNKIDRNDITEIFFESDVKHYKPKTNENKIPFFFIDNDLIIK